MKVLHTIELEPDSAGTVIHMRFAPPKSRREQGLMQHIGPAYGEALQSGFPSLLAPLNEALAAHDADGGLEPELTAPRPDSVLTGLEPLVIVG